MSGLGIAGIVVGLGFVILLLAGLGILTTAIFEIKEYKRQGITDEAQAILNTITDAELKLKLTTVLTTNIAEKGIYTINLSGSKLVVSKITIITIWILIIIGLFGAKFIM